MASQNRSSKCSFITLCTNSAEADYHLLPFTAIVEPHPKWVHRFSDYSFIVYDYWLHVFTPQLPFGSSNSCTYSWALFRYGSGAVYFSRPLHTGKQKAAVENKGCTPGAQYSSATKVLLCQDSLRFWRSLKRI